MRARAPETLPLYVGGFLGPFGGAVLAVLVPQLPDAFGAGTAAVALSPLCGGLLGAPSWRWAFIAPAAVAAGLALLPPADAPPRAADAGPARLRALLDRRVGYLSAAAFAGYAGGAGVGFLVAVDAADAFGPGSGQPRGVRAGFGVAGM